MLRSLIGLPLLALTGCHVLLGPSVTGTGTISQQVRQIAEFESVLVKGAADVEYIVSAEPFCEVEIDENLQSHVKANVVDGLLTISIEGNIRPSQRMHVRLSSQELKAFSTAGSCSFIAQDLHSPTFDLSISGSGKAELLGAVDKLTISVAGSGTVDSRQLVANRVDVSVSGSGSLKVHAEQKLDVSIAGSGKVEYEGNAEVSQSIAGSGSVKRIATAE